MTHAGNLERIFRESSGQAVATLVRVFGDITLAEDAVQDAFAVATDRWPIDGFPPNPAGWIVTTARNRAIDVLRRSNRGRELEEQAAVTYVLDHDDEEDVGPVQDDQLRLIFTCCHPSLRREHQVALTLRLLGGLSVDEVARSFFVSEAAMVKRLVRAKYKIRAARIPYRVPGAADLPSRLGAVLSVLYLIYNTGADNRGRSELRSEAIRLSRSVVALLPDEPEAAGLLALMLLNESRAESREVDGSIVLLRDQDRSKWDRALIAEGHTIVRDCVRRDRPGPFQLQASIQAVHCNAVAFGDTDWAQIVALYNHLITLLPTPVVTLNRAIAIAEVDGPEAGLAELETIGSGLDGYHLLHSTRATLLRQLGRTDAAHAAFRRARESAVSEVDRRFLAEQISQLVDDRQP